MHSLDSADGTESAGSGGSGDSLGTARAETRTGVQQRSLVALVQVLGLSVWFSASAVVPTLEEQWGISLAAGVWLTASTQVGFAVGAVVSAVLNLADRYSAPRLLAGSAFAAAACTAAFATITDGLALGIPLRFLTGLFLAGVYPVGMKLMASWSPVDRRGAWFGVLIGALTVGSAMPHLIRTADLPWQTVMLLAAGITALAGLVSATLLRQGPFVGSGRPKMDPRYVVRMLQDRPQRLVNLGYFGHMWELYALWTWFPVFVAAAPSAADSLSPGALSLTAFAVIGIAGMAGCLLGGWSADRFGRPGSARAALAVSGACCLVSPLLFAAPTVVVLALSLVWGAAVIADSGVFSTMLSEVAESEYAGTALTAQTAIGFLLTIITIQVVPVVAELVGWQWAFLVLVPGPAIGVYAMSRLHPLFLRAREAAS